MNKYMKSGLMASLIAALAMGTNAGALGTPAGSTVTNTATLESLADDGVTRNEVFSNPVSLAVQHVPSVVITPDGTFASPGQTQPGTPGQDGVLTYSVSNPSNGPDSVAFTVVDSGQNPAGTTVYVESDGTPGLTAGDTIVTAPVSFTMDETKTVYVSYRVPSTALSTETFEFDLVGTTTSRIDGVPGRDDSNVGRVAVADVNAIQFVANRTGNVTTPGTVSYQHTLTNTGNTQLDASEIVVTVGTVPGGWSYTYTVNGGAAQTTPQAAIAAWGGNLQPGQSLQLGVNVSAPANLAAGTQDVTSVAASVSATLQAGDQNQSSTPVQLTDTTTVIKANGGLAKSAESCGTDPLAEQACSSARGLNNGALIRPGEFLRYTMRASNTGNSGLLRPVITDSIPGNTEGVRWTGSSVGAGKVLYSLDNASWSASAPSIAGQENTQVYLGYDSNNDNTITAADSLAPGETMQMQLTVQVK